MIGPDALGGEIYQFGLVLIAAIAASVLGALSGFGSGLMVMPFLMPVVGVKGVIPVMTVAMLIGNSSRIWANREHLDLKPIRWVLLAALPGSILGTLIYDWLPAEAVAVLIGVVLILIVPIRWAMKGRAIRPSPAGGAAIGFGFGVLAGSSPGAGTLMLAVLLGLGLTGPALIGTDAVLGVGINVVKALMFGGLDLLSAEWIALGLAIGAVMFPGAYLARYLVARLPVRVHVAFIELLVVACGLSFLWRGWTL